MSDPLSCRDCAAWYRENRQDLLKARDVDQAGHEFMVDVYSDVASMLPPSRTRGVADSLAKRKFDKGGWINEMIRRYHDSGHVTHHLPEED